MNDEFFEEDENEENKEDYKKMLSQQQETEEVQIHLAHRDLDLRLLAKSIKVAEKALFWRFYSLERKMKNIIVSYNILAELLSPNFEDNEDIVDEDIVEE